MAAAIAVALWGAAAQAQPADPQAANPGRDLYLQYCASCHGAEGDGRGPMAGELRTPPADLTLLGEHFGSPLQTQRLLERIDGRRMARAHGSRDMPVWGEQLARQTPRGAGTEAHTRGRLLVIIDWLQSIQQEP